MNQLDHILQYKLILQTQGPVFIGTGSKLSKTEYCFLPNGKVISVLDDNKFINFLVEKNLINEYEAFVGQASSHPDHADLLRDFLKPNHITESNIKEFTKFIIRAADALDSKHSLKEVYLFVRNARGKLYIPGSSVKGALRTALLTSMLIHKPYNGSFTDSKTAEILEASYLNRPHDGEKPSPLNSIMRGLSISDSEPISQKNMILCKKNDLTAQNTIKSINLVRECIRPKVTVKFSLTIDKNICVDWDKDYILKCLEDSGKFFKKTYLPSFKSFTGYVPDAPLLFLGGGSGYYTKNIVYPAKGEGQQQEAVEIVSRFMQKKFFKHHHQNDVQLGISPHTLKIAEYQNQKLLMGLCTAALM